MMVLAVNFYKKKGRAFQLQMEAIQTSSSSKKKHEGCVTPRTLTELKSLAYKHIMSKRRRKKRALVGHRLAVSEFKHRG